MTVAVAAAPCRGRTTAGLRCQNTTRNTSRLCGQCVGPNPTSTTAGQAAALAALADSLATDPLQGPGGELLEGLNPDQIEAVTHDGGPLVVIAGAGSGKTGVLTRRAAWLVEAEGVAPEEITAVTFTNKAAEEMRSRVAALVGADAADRMTIGTFHATCAELLRDEHEAFGYPEDFSIYDTEDTEALLSGAMKALDIDRDTLTLKQARSFISEAKSNLRGPGEGLDPDDPTSVATHRLYAEYQRRLRMTKALDFDDLVGRTVQLLQDDPAVRARARRRSRHLLLDEYQDTNPAQTALVGLLAGDERHVFAVGDPDQSIYGFRAASAANLTGFAELFPTARTVTLNRNYRSTQTILDAANAVIAPNAGRPPREMVSALGVGEPIVFYEAADEVEEAGWVAERIGQLAEGGTEGHQVAVLTRTNAGLRPIAQRLADAGTPYVVKDGSSLADSKEARAVLAHLRILSNPHDDIAFQRALMSTKGVGGTALAKLRSWADTHEQPLSEAVRYAEEAGLTGATRNAVIRFTEVHDALVNQARAGGEGATPGALMGSLDEMTGYSDKLEGSLAVAMQNLRNSAQTHTEVPEFLERLALGDASDTESPRGFVTLSTVHAAKGLEWDNVFMVGMEEGVMPLGDEEEAEERRLAYVGMTRAGQRLHLSAAASRASFGIPAFSPTSRYVRDVPSHLMATATEGLAVEPFSVPPRQGAIGMVTGRRSDGRLVVTMPAPDPEVVESFALSPTAIDGNSRCPTSAYFKHLARMRVQSSPQARIGTHFHAIVERLHGLAAQERTPEAAQRFADEVEAEWRANEHYADFTDEHYAEARGLLAGYFALEDPRQVRTVSAEQRMRATLGDGTVLSGVIDRLERDADGTLVVTDYKTGRQSKGSATPWAVHQGRLYASLVRAETGETPSRVRILYPRSDAGAEPKILDVGISDDDIAHAEHLAMRAGASLRQSLSTNQYVACPGNQCRRCDFSDS